MCGKILKIIEFCVVDVCMFALEILVFMLFFNEVFYIVFIILYTMYGNGRFETLIPN